MAYSRSALRATEACLKHAHAQSTGESCGENLSNVALLGLAWPARMPPRACTL